MKNLRLARSQKNIRLDQEIGRGGEGIIYGLVGCNDSVAKIYLLQPDDRKVQKLLIMAETANSAVLKIAAWPTDVLIDDRGQVCGFVMPRVIARRSVHELYSPKSRSVVFPEADFRFLVHVGANIARAFAVVHELGNILGDVNHGNVLIGPDGTAILIDCDSFQVSRGQNIFTCDVGVPLFTPPELQGKPFRGLRRHRDHDIFGLAVILFHLLFMGRHPFAGRYLGNGEMPIEKAIAEYRFAYGPDRHQRQMESPPATLSLEGVGYPVADLFSKAFVKNGVGASRPAASTWVNALENLKSSLRECPYASWHHFQKQLNICPWCRIEQETGVRLFGIRIIQFGPSGTMDIDVLWRPIENVLDPGLPPPIPSEKFWSPPAGVELPGANPKGLRKVISVGLILVGLASSNAAVDGGFVVALILYCLAYIAWPKVASEKINEADKAVSTAKSEWESFLRFWHSHTSRDLFESKYTELKKVKSELQDLPEERQRRFARLEEQKRINQKIRYLDRFRINKSSIPGIGPMRTSMLESYGIETAADIESSKIMSIPGFGDVLTLSLMEWRESHEKNFRYNPSEPVDPLDRTKLEQELRIFQESRVAKLKQGSAELLRISQEIIAARQRLMPKLERAWTALKIAEAQRSAL